MGSLRAVPRQLFLLDTFIILAKMKKIKSVAEPRYIVAFNSHHPTKYVVQENVQDQYVKDMDVYATTWQTTNKMSEARSYTITDASIVCAVLNKINKCYYRIVPIFEMQTFESKLNAFPDEF